MRPLLLLGLIAAPSACIPYTPPAPPQPRTASAIAAPFDRTWNAVIDVFAEQVITIETMERASGFIVASRGALGNRTKADSVSLFTIADCGRGSTSTFDNIERRFLPSSAKYNVVVRAVGEGSTVLVTTKFLTSARGEPLECTSTGKFENDFEALVRRKAEGTQRD